LTNHFTPRRGNRSRSTSGGRGQYVSYLAATPVHISNACRSASSFLMGYPAFLHPDPRAARHIRSVSVVMPRSRALWAYGIPLVLSAWCYLYLVHFEVCEDLRKPVAHGCLQYL
jgi:hypothetical protein